MNIAILGAGALGSILAAHLARGGEEVVLLARGARADYLRQHGVRLTGLADFTQAVPVVTNPRDVKSADVLIVTVKTYDTETALEGVSHIDAGCVLSIQNGIYKNEQLQRCFGAHRTLGAIAVFSGEVMQDGVARFTINEGFYIGETPAGDSPRVEGLVAALNRSGIRSFASSQIRSAEWSKFVIFAGAMVLAALTRLETYKALKDTDLAYLRVILQNEMAELAGRLGIPLLDLGTMRVKTQTSIPVEEAVAQVVRDGEAMEDRGATTHKVSTLQDLERGRRIEVEETLGYAVRKGQELGLSMPNVEFSYRLLSGINRYLK